MKLSSDLIEKFTFLGLGDTEARIYTLLLQHSPLSVQEISGSLQVGRTNIYPHLRQLVAHNLVNELPKKRGYQVTSPSELRRLIAAQQLEVQEKSLFLEALLPTLKNLTPHRDTSAVSTHLPPDGERTVVNLILQNSASSLLHVRPQCSGLQDPTALFQEVHRKGISVEALTVVSPENYQQFSRLDQVYKTVVQFTDPADTGDIPEILLSSNLVCIQQKGIWTSCSEPIIVDTYTTLVTALWNTSEPAQNSLERRWKRLHGKSIG